LLELNPHALTRSLLAETGTESLLLPAAGMPALAGSGYELFLQFTGALLCL